jgi:predicted phosphodiesterase
MNEQHRLEDRTVRIAAVSDIHGNMPALEAVLADIARNHVDQIINLGDCLSGPLWPVETGDRLMELGWLALAGNHERRMMEPDAASRSDADGFAAARLTPAHATWIASMPPKMMLRDDLFVCHGTPADDDGYWLHRGGPGAMRKARLDEIAADLTSLGLPAHGLALCGHTHVPRVVTLPDGRTVANPGSVGLPAYDDDRCPDALEPGGLHSRYLIAEWRNGSWHVELRAVPYDFERSAERAEINGFPRWAHTLRTGRVCC